MVLPRLQKITLALGSILTRLSSMFLLMRETRFLETFLMHGRHIMRLLKKPIQKQKLRDLTIPNMVGERRAEILRIIFNFVPTITVYQM